MSSESRLRSMSSVGALAALLLFSSCQTPPASVVPPAGTLNESTGTQTAQPKLRIATFNIQNLGETKMRKSEVVAELVSLIRKYDLVAVQEIDDQSLKTPAAFLTQINAASGPRYSMVVSSMSGTTATSNQDEQYAYYYNAEKVEALDSGALYPDPEDRFIREPFAAHFRAKRSKESFVMLTVHTEASKTGAAREIAALEPAAAWAGERYAGELGVVVLGDFNAGVTYLSVQEVAAIRAAHLPHLWIVPDNADTTNSSIKDQAHDRVIVIGHPLEARFTGDWGVDRTVSSKAVSDHLPVWADFWFAGRN